MKDLRTIGRWL